MGIYSSILAIGPSLSNTSFDQLEQGLLQFIQSVGVRVQPGDLIRQLFVPYGIFYPVREVVGALLQSEARLKDMKIDGIDGDLVHMTRLQEQ